MIYKFFSFLFKTALGVALMVWCIGFAAYVGTVTSYVQPEIDVNMPRTDVIVVLTGGSDRLQAGINLMAAGKGEHLLITGVNPDVDDESVLNEVEIPARIKECCVTMGRAAGDTYGNADEAKEFMLQNDYKSLTLVTAHYHMPRSLLAFQEMMPEAEIIPYPVAPSSVNLTEWWNSIGTLKLLISEYSKYAAAWINDKVML